MTTDLKKAQRLDNRRTPGHMGRGPDQDEVVDTGSARRGSVGSFNHTQDGSFWKHSELLACNAGVRMRRVDYRGLPEGYATGPSWMRARSESS